jgi:ElaB/YqjD/DUF883 family membrane-anchored ribosome-binding protein
MPEPNTREKFNPEQSTPDPRPDRVQPIRGGSEQVASAKVIAWRRASEQEVDDVTNRASQALDEVGQRVSAAYDRVQSEVAEAFDRTMWKSEELARRARSRARYVLDNYPVHLIAGIAGMAFVAGILLRVWRSNRYD